MALSTLHKVWAFICVFVIIILGCYHSGVSDGRGISAKHHYQHAAERTPFFGNYNCCDCHAVDIDVSAIV